MKSWQVFHYARKVLSNEIMMRIFSRSYPLITRWASDPRYCENHTRNPIDRITIMLTELDRVGYGEVARAGIDIQANPLGGQFAFRSRATSDKGTVDGESADAIVALGHLVTVVRKALADRKIEPAERAVILDAARVVVREIDELLDAAEKESK